METRYSKKALRGRMKTPAKVRKQLDVKVAAYAKDPEGVHGFALKMVDYPETRIRQGAYRALVLIDKEGLFVKRYGHRKDVYEDY